MWGKVISIALATLATYFIVKHWNEIVHEIAAWARNNDYRGVIRVICKIEEVRAGIVQVTFQFLGKKGEMRLENPPLITEKTINYQDLPSEFQYLGTREHEMTID
jgi:hypothetical protein